MAKLPAIQFYPGDWLLDSIAGCSLAAQGLWLRMMFIAHNSDRYGYLMLDGKPLSPEAIARRCGCSLEQYLPLLAELDAASIPSRTKTSVIFSRRMVRDAETRAANRMYQSTHRNTIKTKANSKTDVRPMSDVSSTSTSSSITEESKDSLTQRPEDFANSWNSHRGMLPKVKEFTDSRRKKVQARIRQGVTLERFTEAVQACTTMPFLLGTNKNGWVASFDWLIENDRNLLKVLEGNYKDVGGTIRGTNQFSSPTLEREQRSNSAIADARETLRRNLGLDGADEEQLPIAGDQFIDGSGVDGALDEAGPGTRVATIQGSTVEAF